MANAVTSRPIVQCSGISYGNTFDSDVKNIESRRVLNLKMLNTSFDGLRSRSGANSLQLHSNLKHVSAGQSEMVRRAYPNGQQGTVICATGGMKIVFVGAETAPWSKIGGLGDVLGGLPPAMAANGHRVMTIAPRYDQYHDAWDTSAVVQVKVGDRYETVRFFHVYKRGVDRVFVDHPWFLEKVWGKTGGKLYGPTTGSDYKDNQLRYSLLCQAALEAPRVLNLNNNPYFSGPYGEDVVFVANDWHTALVPCYLKAVYQPQGIYKNAKVVFCVHNISYQGRFAPEDFGTLNLPDHLKPTFEFFDQHDKPVKGNKINWMKAGILVSDKVATVSPYYAQEIVSGTQRGVELDSILNRTGITGIMNGMDVNEWNPMTDKFIPANYDATDVKNAKATNKAALQAEVGLPVKDVPVIAFIARLEEQKGSDILAAAIPKFMDENCQIIILGSGKERMESELKQLEEKYPNQVKVHTGFNVPLSHLMMAGADYLIITSRFEPGGLIQLQGMRYGTPCIVATTGGLADTVHENFTGFHMGCFSADCDYVDPQDVQKVVQTLKRALSVYGTPTFNQMIHNCLAQDFSWKQPAKKWEEFLLGIGASGNAGISGEEIAPLAAENLAAP